LEQFRDPVSRDKRFSELVGRGWSVTELRRKNFDDLHKLWYVLYKERNMLLTEAYISNQNGAYFPQPERRQKVKKSMAAIKVVLGERKRDKIAQHALKMARIMDETKGMLEGESDSDFNEDDSTDTPKKD
jgi:large subunit ribosomal protein L47